LKGSVSFSLCLLIWGGTLSFLLPSLPLSLSLSRVCDGNLRVRGEFLGAVGFRDDWIGLPTLVGLQTWMGKGG
jgi:hypothetical protein